MSILEREGMDKGTWDGTNLLRVSVCVHRVLPASIERWKVFRAGPGTEK
jgi:hypothetical protein